MNSNFPYQGCLSRKLIGGLLLAIALGGCGGGGGGEAGTPGYKPGSGPEEPGPEPDPDLEVLVEAWPFEEEQSHLVAAAKVAGYYAVANASSMAIEIRDISKSVLHTISASEISPLLPDMGLAHDAPICGMTFTPSGRFLYIAVCNSQTGDDKDAILALNINTETLSVFDRVSLSSISKSPQSHYGMSYFASQLYVGSDTGVYRYNADRNSVYLGGAIEEPDHISTPKAVKDIALDMVAKHLYVLTDDTIYRLPHTEDSQNTKESLSTVYKDSNLSRLSFSRVFGRDSAAGLYLTRDNNDDTEFLFVPKDKVRKNNTFSPEQVNFNISNVLDFTTTADGKILYSDGQVFTLADKLDDKLSYQGWLRDELAQYVTAIKSLISSDNFSTTNNFTPFDGFLHRKLQRVGTNPNTTPIADTVGWAVYLLLAADKVNPDHEIEELIELLIERHAGLKDDGQGGLKTVDGHFVRQYETDGTPNTANPQPQVYTSMKFLPAVYKAAEMYPDNEKIAEALAYLQQVFVRSSDTIRARQTVTWRVDDFGPERNNNGMANETWLYGDLGAAQDPRATNNYATYVYDRTNFKYDDWLKGEPVILSKHAAFIVMGGTLVLEHHFKDPDWKEQNNNYYAVTQAASDDLGSPYFAAFSAGNNPEAESGNYYNDGPADHPGNILHFPALLGFGQHGKLGAMVGGYFAYRDGLRQAMLNGAGGDDIKLLTRWSMNDPNYLMEAVGIADFWFGAIGLAEAISPGTTAELRNTFFRPEVSWDMDSDDNQVVFFSAITPRHVSGLRDDGSMQSFGFQRSPFTVPSGQKFKSFLAVDPEGDWVELDDIVSAKHDKKTIFTNPDFENGLAGWKKKGDGAVELTDGVTGQGAKVQGNSILSQAVYQPLALENSRFRVSAFIRPEQASTAKGFIRTGWAESGDSNAVLSNTVDSNTTEAGDSGQLVSVDTSKPKDANYLHIEYVVEGGAGQSFVFDNTALQFFGASHEIDNGDFEDGSRNWDLSNGQVSIINDQDLVPEGKQALEFLLSGGMRSWRSAETDIDVSNDPVGTRYIFRLTLGEHAITDSEFEIKIDITDDDPNTKTVDWKNVAAIEKESPDEITFTMRKRPGEMNFRVIFRMRQNSTESVATDRVVIDNLRLDKQRLLLAEECTGSVTGC
ncbi:hypothetical protein L4D76_16955 [Photobacterium sagamiensis]|uniref:hypothetical protein n=1 Tax=Photobacterium sagamiensis TaxID=2910241 RepID=UPI003D0EAC59